MKTGIRENITPRGDGNVLDSKFFTYSAQIRENITPRGDGNQIGNAIANGADFFDKREYNSERRRKLRTKLHHQTSILMR